MPQNKCFTFARYSPQCESSILFAMPHERQRMLTNTYEYLAIILRSLRLVANCIRKPILHIFATMWRICREYIFLHSQGYSPQCETSITFIRRPTFVFNQLSLFDRRKTQFQSKFLNNNFKTYELSCFNTNNNLMWCN